jgi:hypothetical protein
MRWFRTNFGLLRDATTMLTRSQFYPKCVVLSVAVVARQQDEAARVASLRVRRARRERGIGLVRRVELRLERVARPTLRAIAAHQPPERSASSSGQGRAKGDPRRQGDPLTRGRRRPRRLPTSTMREASAPTAGLPARRGVGTTLPRLCPRCRRGRAHLQHGRAASGCLVVGRVRVVVVIRDRCA